MPIRFSDLGGKVRHVRVQWQDLELNVTYSPSANTTGMQLSVMQAAADDPVEGTRKAIELLEEIMIGWDFMKEPSTNGDGEMHEEPEPITQATLMRLPATLVNAIIERIRDDDSPNRKRSGR